MMSVALKQSLWQMPALVLLACLIAAGVNHWRSDGIPIIGDWSVEARFSDAAGESPVIALDRARHLFEQDAAVFVDARPESRYSQGHIRGALNLPWQDADRFSFETAGRLEGAKTIITYCDGEDCEPGHELALFLKTKGIENVRVLVDGWSAWQEAGFPVAIGK
jgi:rhodanese-related sulfurtransferase